MIPRLRTKARSSFTLAVGLGVLSTLSAYAQTVPANSSAKKQDEEVQLEKFVVTGSLIPMAADTPAIPVSVITSVDIKNSGVSNDLLQVLKKTEPFFYGANNIGSDNGNISSAPAAARLPASVDCSR